MRKILLIVLVLLFSIIFTSCKDKNENNKGYDGKVFDISTTALIQAIRILMKDW